MDKKTRPATDTLPKLSCEEMLDLKSSIRELYHKTKDVFPSNEQKMLINQLKKCICQPAPIYDEHGISYALTTIKTALLFIEKLDTDHDMLLAILLFDFVRYGIISTDQITKQWGNDVTDLIEGIEKVNQFSSRNSVTNQDNFRGLLLSLTKDIRVIIIMIVRNLVLMRTINHHTDQDWVRSVAFEANCLYAQLAHRLGLYSIKGELEDLSLKYTNREIFTQIAHKLQKTKRDRESYIDAFIKPVKEKLEAAGLKFDIKGRTKSISSIWAKIKKQKIDMEHIYDLFAIRVIIDTPKEKEKSDCWLAYSIVADMYTANPARMKDWISIPKSNGYESLHATVMGPDKKWVEVQFRTRRMDLIAEKGLAAHWRYKGVKSDNTDQWMNNIRDILETAEEGPMQLMKNMRMNYDKEVYAFTPKGDLFKLSAGSTILDFAFHIHSRLGCSCSGAIVNGRHEKITYKIKNGDTIEILTTSSQTPKQDWLSIVVTSKAKNKIRQTLNEQKLHKANLGKEMFERRCKNRKIEIDETLFMRILKKIGYKLTNDFFYDIAEEKIDINRILSTYTEIDKRENEAETIRIAADEFKIQNTETEQKASDDVIIIGDKNIKGLNYKLAQCCRPIYGDNVFGFVSTDGIIKIHRTDCPNAKNIRERYPYRLINVKWSGIVGDQLPVTLRILGHDDIGIVTNITSVITKEKNVSLRNISIDSNDGLFQGYIVIGIADIGQLNSLIKKLKTIKGVKDIQRS